MGIDSLDSVIVNASAERRWNTIFMKQHPNAASTATCWHSSWTFTGIPAAGLYTGSALESVQCADTTVGGIYHGGGVSAYVKHLTKFAFMCSGSLMVPGMVMIYDRLLYYPGIDASVNTSQALTNSAALPRYTTGVGVRAWLEVSTVFGGVQGTFTFGTSGYTNSAGTTGRQHGVTCLTAASAIATRIPHSGSTVQNLTWNPFLPMQAGDLGIKSVESVRFTTAPGSGDCALVLGFPLALIPVADASLWTERDLCFQVPSMPRIYDGACLSFLYCPLAALQANSVINGEVECIWG